MWAFLWRCSFRESKPLLLIKRCACDVLFLSPTKPVFLYLIIRFLKALADIWILIVFKALETTKYLYFIPLNLLSLKKLIAAILCWFEVVSIDKYYIWKKYLSQIKLK